MLVTGTSCCYTIALVTIIEKIVQQYTIILRRHKRFIFIIIQRNIKHKYETIIVLLFIRFC